MTTKQLSDLNSITTVANSDLLLVREVSTGTDSKITVANFSKGIGTSATVGFTAVAANGEIVLTPSNLATVQEYKDGMIISFKAPLDNLDATIINVKIGNLASKPLYSYNSATGFKFALNDYIQAVYYTDSFNRINPQIKITDADEAQVAEKDDYLSINSAGVSKKIKFSALVQSMGEPTVFGFTATNTGTVEAPVLTLTPSNSGSVTAYKNGMKISFRAPLTISKTTVVTNIKIGNLDNVPLYKYNTQNNCVYTQDDFVEAIFVDNKFYRVGDYSAVVFSNEYRVLNSVIEVINDVTFTTLTLVSAYGISKPEYYEGMQLNFVCPIDTQGTVRVNLDGLNNVVLMDTMDGQFENTLNSDLFTGQFVQATLIKTPLLIFKRNIFALNDVRKNATPEFSIISDPQTEEDIIVENLDNAFVRIINLNNSSPRFFLKNAIQQALDDTNYQRSIFYIKIERMLTSDDAIIYRNIDLSKIILISDNNIIQIKQWNCILDSCNMFKIQENTTFESIPYLDYCGLIFIIGGAMKCYFKNITFLYKLGGQRTVQGAAISIQSNDLNQSPITLDLLNVNFINQNNNNDYSSKSMIYIHAPVVCTLKNVTLTTQSTSIRFPYNALVYYHNTDQKYTNVFKFENCSIQHTSTDKCLLFIVSKYRESVKAIATNISAEHTWAYYYDSTNISYEPATVSKTVPWYNTYTITWDYYQ